MIDVHYHFLLENPLSNEVAAWASMLEISGLDEDYQKRYEGQDEKSVLHFFCFDLENPSSILSSLKQARENARTIRDQLSSEVFQCLNRIYLELREWDVNRVLRNSPFAFFGKVKDGSHLLRGILSRTMMRTETMDFLLVGQYLERADQTARILDVKLVDLVPVLMQVGSASRSFEQGQSQIQIATPDNQAWSAVLKSVGAFEAYRKTCPQGVVPEQVADFLVLNNNFPASIRFCIHEVHVALRRISGNANYAPSNEAERVVGRLDSDLNFSSAKEIIDNGLHDFLENVQVRCGEVGNSIWATYLSY